MNFVHDLSAVAVSGQARETTAADAAQMNPGRPDRKKQ
jgi:hypothetical protein